MLAMRQVPTKILFYFVGIYCGTQRMTQCLSLFHMFYFVLTSLPVRVTHALLKELRQEMVDDANPIFGIPMCSICYLKSYV